MIRGRRFSVTTSWSFTINILFKNSKLEETQILGKNKSGNVIKYIFETIQMVNVSEKCDADNHKD